MTVIHITYIKYDTDEFSIVNTKTRNNLTAQYLFKICNLILKKASSLLLHRNKNIIRTRNMIK